ncbi:MAG: T9SS type A sorting domain-containing protein, partial [Bacteroidota bacterium]
NTQFMLSAPGSAGMVTFTGSADPEFAPVLNVTYGPQTTSIAEAVDGGIEDLLVVYPNPTNGMLFISNRSNKAITSIEVFDIPGRLVYKSNDNVNAIDLGFLRPGGYLVRMVTDEGQVIVKRFQRN